MSASYKTWGSEIDQAAHAQMHNACALPVTSYGALMPDAHVGYGLPIGGVIATENSVIPYAVGVDIACRVMLTVLDLPLSRFEREQHIFSAVLKTQTFFGIGSTRDQTLDHPVLDEDWNISPLVRSLKDKAWRQLGTSGSGNHFVEFGEFELLYDREELKAGKYLGLVSHSGSRGSGAAIASHYSKIAEKSHPELNQTLKQLAWLTIPGDGEEYFQAMQLMGRYASANHQIIHREILRALSAKSLFQVENHHNFAWREEVGGKNLFVHRKGATPAHQGVLGYIPGTMVDPGFLVEGRGEPSSINSCSHGAGRKMSRNKARENITRKALDLELQKKKVTLISAGLDEAPQAYKDINSVMREQEDLVNILGRFQPRLVKMAPAGEEPED
ncbi:RtcB family protein [bacterium]|nr:RtcB family protein [bacterium]